MNIIRGPKVVQTRMFYQDSIPYKSFAIADNMEKFKKKYSFSNVQIPYSLYDDNIPVKVIDLSDGHLALNNDIFLINKLILADRRIIIDVESSSKDADLIYDDIKKEIGQIDSSGYFEKSECLVKTELTSCIAHLNFDYKKLISKQLNDFIKREIPKLSEYEISNITLKGFSFEVNYVQSSDFVDKSFMLAPKILAIEPRINTPEKENVFFTSSPFDSDTHMKLLTDLESKF